MAGFFAGDLQKLGLAHKVEKFKHQTSNIMVIQEWSRTIEAELTSLSHTMPQVGGSSWAPHEAKNAQGPSMLAGFPLFPAYVANKKQETRMYNDIQLKMRNMVGKW